ncbi:hypothetical protein ACE400_29305, partial [Salmonella enterica]|uniref:hypothetical protein n=1 Tax=Salmonella enterica TaxID=28901 RepID=UPI003D28F451
ALSDNLAYLRYVRASVLFYHSHYAEEARAMAAEVPTMRLMVCIDAEDGEISSLDRFMLPEGSPPVPDGGEPTGNGEDLTAIIATGGTTGP